MTPAQIGARIAARVFKLRGRGKPRVEIHISQADLAELLALAAETAVRDASCRLAVPLRKEQP